MGTLKKEMLQDGHFQNLHDARSEIFEYIDGYYNTQRQHSSLGYQSPAAFEATFYHHQQLTPSGPKFRYASLDFEWERRPKIFSERSKARFKNSQKLTIGSSNLEWY